MTTQPKLLGLAERVRNIDPDRDVAVLCLDWSGDTTRGANNASRGPRRNEMRPAKRPPVGARIDRTEFGLDNDAQARSRQGDGRGE